MEKKNVLQAGFAKVDITPDFSVGLAGYGQEDTKRRSEGVLDHIYLTCIAVTSGEDTILLFDADLCNVSDWGVEQICKVVCPATGIPAERIYCGATHSHSAPSFYEPMESQRPFHQLLLKAAVQAAQEALADRAPTQLLTATKKLKNMNFVRHYLMEDGTYFGSNFGNPNQRFINHAAESDPRLMLVKFARQEKKDIVLMNWQAHNDQAKAAGFYMLSSSYTGRVREKFEAETGMHFAFFQGASGNQNPGSKIEQENHGLVFISYGYKLAEYAIAALQDLKPVEGTDIVTTRLVFQAPVDHSLDHKLEQAKEVLRVWETVDIEAARALATTYGFPSFHAIGSVVRKAEMGETVPIVMNAFRIGNLGFITAPNELFSTIGLHVRLHGPFESTFIITGNKGYLPCMAAYEYGSYEALGGYYAKGAAEAVADTFVEMLESIQ